MQTVASWKSLNNLYKPLPLHPPFSLPSLSFSPRFFSCVFSHFCLLSLVLSATACFLPFSFSRFAGQRVCKERQVLLYLDLTCSANPAQLVCMTHSLFIRFSAGSASHSPTYPLLSHTIMPIMRLTSLMMCICRMHITHASTAALAIACAALL